MNNPNFYLRTAKNGCESLAAMDLLMKILGEFRRAVGQTLVPMRYAKTKHAFSFFVRVESTGQVVIKPRFDSGGEFIEGIAPVMVGAVHADVPQTRIKNGYIDRTGKYVWRPSQ